MKIGLFSFNVFIDVDFPVDLGSSCEHGLFNEEFKGHMCSEGSSRIITRGIVSKSRGPEVMVDPTPRQRLQG